MSAESANSASLESPRRDVFRGMHLTLALDPAKGLNRAISVAFIIANRGRTSAGRSVGSLACRRYLSRFGEIDYQLFETRARPRRATRDKMGR